MILPPVDLVRAKRAENDRYCFDRNGFENVLRFYAYGMDLSLDLRDSKRHAARLSSRLAAAETVIAEINADRLLAHDIRRDYEVEKKKDELKNTVVIVVSTVAALIAGFFGGYAIGKLAP